VTSGPYQARWTKSARRAVAEQLPEGVAVAAVELVTGPLCAPPRRVGKPLGEELVGIYSARLGRDWRVLYEIDEVERLVIVLDIRHRAAAYRRR
jgi:mRNA interferase RelE/StbE